MHEQLQCAQGLLARVANTGPLMSLLSAGDFRREFLHIHRDLSGAFTLLGTGEKLLVGFGWFAAAAVWLAAGLTKNCWWVLAGLLLQQQHEWQQA